MRVWQYVLVGALVLVGGESAGAGDLQDRLPDSYQESGGPGRCRHPVAQAPLGRAAFARSRWSARLDVRPGPGGRGLGASGVRRRPSAGCRHPGAPGSRAGSPGRRRLWPGRRAAGPTRRRQDRARSVVASAVRWIGSFAARTAVQSARRSSSGEYSAVAEPRGPSNNSCLTWLETTHLDNCTVTACYSRTPDSLT
jgi:hypothetical protein